MCSASASSSFRAPGDVIGDTSALGKSASCDAVSAAKNSQVTAAVPRTAKFLQAVPSKYCTGAEAIDGRSFGRAEAVDVDGTNDVIFT